MLWLPMYLADQGFQAFEGYISVSYSLCSIFGVTLFGSVFEKTTKRRVHYAVCLLGICTGILILLLVYELRLEPSQEWTLLALIGGVGLCSGGLFSIYSNHEVQLHALLDGQSLLLCMNFIHGCMHLFVGATQIIIGFVAAQSSNGVIQMSKASSYCFRGSEQSRLC